MFIEIVKNIVIKLKHKAFREANLHYQVIFNIIPNNLIFYSSFVLPHYLFLIAIKKHTQ